MRLIAILGVYEGLTRLSLTEHLHDSSGALVPTLDTKSGRSITVWRLAAFTQLHVKYISIYHTTFKYSVLTTLIHPKPNYSSDGR